MKKEIKIIFVCLGNICRSPMAEALFAFTAQKSVNYNYLCDSAGTSAYHIGSSPDERMQAKAKKYNIPMQHRAKQFSTYHFHQFDFIFAMDRDNYNNIISLAKNDEEKAKVFLIRDFEPKIEQTNLSVPDPYYNGDKSFEEVFNMLKRCCENIFHLLETDSLVKKNQS